MSAGGNHLGLYGPHRFGLKPKFQSVAKSENHVGGIGAFIDALLITFGRGSEERRQSV